MSPMIKRWTATSLALAMAVSMGVSVSAKPTSSKNLDLTKLQSTSTSTATAQPASASDYAINVSGTTIQFLKGGNVVTSYNVKAPANASTVDLNVVLSQSGNLCLNFVKADTGNATNVSLGQQANVAFSGDLSTLTIDTTVPSNRSFSVVGNVTTLNVNAPVAVTIGATANLNSLKVGNKSASVAVESGAKVAAAAASNASAVTGLTNVGTMAEVTTSVTGAAAAPASTGTTSSEGASSVTSGGLKVEMADASTTKKYAESIAYGSNNTITILPKNNRVTLGNLVKDVKLTVRKADTDTMIPGEWKFVGGATESTAASPGTYKYQFTPYQAYKGFDVIIEVVGAGSSNKAVTANPQIAFYSSVGRGAGGAVDVDVTLPAGVTRGDTLELHAGSWSETKTLAPSNAGETSTYTVQIDNDLSDNSKVKVYCVLHTGGKTLTSNTITYTYNSDGDTKTLKKPGLSLSSGHGNGDLTASVTLPASAGKGDEVRVTYNRGSGGSRECGSYDVKDGDGGKTIKIPISVSGDSDDEIKIRATIKSGGSSVSSDTKTYRIED